MTPDQIRTAVLTALSDVAPELEPNMLDSRVELRDQLDLDSMDFLNFVLALHRSLGIDIPEADYRKLGTLDNCVAYLATKLPPQ